MKRWLNMLHRMYSIYLRFMRLLKIVMQQKGKIKFVIIIKRRIRTKNTIRVFLIRKIFMILLIQVLQIRRKTILLTQWKTHQLHRLIQRVRSRTGLTSASKYLNRLSFVKDMRT